jgi:hypothetical protein
MIRHHDPDDYPIEFHIILEKLQTTSRAKFAFCLSRPHLENTHRYWKYFLETIRTHPDHIWYPLIKTAWRLRVKQVWDETTQSGYLAILKIDNQMVDAIIDQTLREFP